MAESARQKRMRELGVSTGTSSPESSSTTMSARQKRMIELGVIEQPKRDPHPANVMRASTVMGDQFANTFSANADRMAKEQTYKPVAKVEKVEEKSFLDKTLDVTKSVGKGLTDFKTKFEDSTSFGLSPFIDKKIIQSGIMPDKFNQDQTERMQRAESSIGGKIGEFAGYIAAGVGIDKAVVKLGGKALEKLSPVVGGLVRGSIAGGVETALQETGDIAFRGKEFNPLNVAFGTAAGGVLGGAIPLIGAGARKILDKYKPTKEVPVAPRLGLPEPKPRGNVNQAVTDDVITPEYTFKLDKPSDNLVAQAKNMDEARADLSALDEEIRTLNIKQSEAVNDQFKLLSEQLKNRQGTVPKGVIQDLDGNVTGNTKGFSKNPEWYQEYYAQYGKVPNRRELYTIAKKQVEEGYTDFGTDIPSWKAQNNYDETVEALTGVRNQISRTLAEQTNNVTDATLKYEAIGFDRTVKQKVTVPQPKPVEAPEVQMKNVDRPLLPQITPKDVLTKPASSGQGWFERLFGTQGVGITPGVRDGKELIDTHIVGNARERGSLVERIGETASWANQNIIDKFAPFRQISDDTYNAAMDSTRANNLATITIKDKFVDLEGNVIGKSLKDVYANVPRGQKHIADRYTIMRDAVSRMDRGIRVYGDEAWFPKTSQEAAEMVTTLEERNPWLIQFGKDWNGFNGNRQDIWVQGGIASQELIDTLRFTNPNYATMQRQQPSGDLRKRLMFNTGKAGFSGQKAPIKRAVGSRKKIIEPAQSMIESTGTTYHALLRNRAMIKMYDAVLANPEKYRGILEIVEETAEMKKLSLDEINTILREEGPEGVIGKLNGELDNIFKKSKQVTSKDDAIVTVMIDGNPVKMWVGETSLLKAIDGISPEQLGVAMTIANTISKMIKISATGMLAPVQGAKLALRDLPIALAQSKDKKRFLFDISHALVSQVGDWLPDFVPGASKLGNLARQYYRAGGGYEAYLKGDSKIRAVSSDLTRDPILSGRNLWKTAKKVNPLKPLKGFGDALENVPRIAAFSAEMRKNGWKRDPESVRAAVDAGREATVNWSRRGIKGAGIEAVLPYSSAAVNGTYRLVKRFKEQPISATLLIMGIAGAKIASYEKFKDDTDYQQRSRWEKGIPVSKTADGKFVTQPVEPTEAFIADQILHFYKWSKDGEKLPSAKETFREGTEALLPKYASGPLASFATEGVPFDPLAGLEATAAGSIMEPINAAISGRNFFGGEIVPYEYRDLPTNLQYDETTSAAGKWAAENLHIDAFTFDYLGEKFGGDIAKIGLPMTSDVGKADPTGNLWDETLTRLKLLEDPVMKNRIADDFYNQSESVTQAKAANLRKDIPFPKWYQGAYDYVTSTKTGSITSQVQALNSTKKDIQRDVGLTAKQRADQLRDTQREINLLRLQGIKIMEDLGVPKVGGR